MCSEHLGALSSALCSAHWGCMREACERGPLAVRAASRVAGPGGAFRSASRLLLPRSRHVCCPPCLRPLCVCPLLLPAIAGRPSCCTWAAWRTSLQSGRCRLRSGHAPQTLCQAALAPLVGAGAAVCSFARLCCHAARPICDAWSTSMRTSSDLRSSNATACPHVETIS